MKIQLSLRGKPRSSKKEEGKVDRRGPAKTWKFGFMWGWRGEFEKFVVPVFQDVACGIDGKTGSFSYSGCMKILKYSGFIPRFIWGFKGGVLVNLYIFF